MRTAQLGDSLVWKNAQTNDTKNRISETMDRIIPPPRPFVTIIHLQIFLSIRFVIQGDKKHAKIQYFKQFQSLIITEYIQNVDRAILNTVFENTVRRVNKCLETGGGTL